MEKPPMILRNGRWETAPPEAAPEPEQAPGPYGRPKKKRKKRRITKAMRMANISNSMKSTGPTSAEGKRTARMNACKHMLTCKEIEFCDDENEDFFWADVDRRARELGAETTEERTLVVNAVYAELTKVRAINAHATAINEARAEIRDQFADGSIKAVREIIPRLVTQPAVAVEELKNSTRGCAFLISQFKILKDRLSHYTGFENGQRRDALRMGGHHVEELFKDWDVIDVNKAFLGAISGVAGFNADEAANAFLHDRPEDMHYGEFTRRFEHLVKDLPSHLDANQKLKGYVDHHIAQLTERQKLVGSREERKLKAALGMAQRPWIRRPCCVSGTWARATGARTGPYDCSWPSRTTAASTATGQWRRLRPRPQPRMVGPGQ